MFACVRFSVQMSYGHLLLRLEKWQAFCLFLPCYLLLNTSTLLINYYSYFNHALIELAPASK